jgi:hypothetical protein
MTPSEQPRLLLRKAAQDLAVLDKLIDDAAIDDGRRSGVGTARGELHLC